MVRLLTNKANVQNKWTNGKLEKMTWYFWAVPEQSGFVFGLHTDSSFVHDLHEAEHTCSCIKIDIDTSVHNINRTLLLK